MQALPCEDTRKSQASAIQNTTFTDHAGTQLKIQLSERWETHFLLFTRHSIDGTLLEQAKMMDASFIYLSCTVKYTLSPTYTLDPAGQIPALSPWSYTHHKMSKYSDPEAFHSWLYIFNPADGCVTFPLSPLPSMTSTSPPLHYCNKGPHSGGGTPCSKL